MLDLVLTITHDLKMRLIELGFELTPPTRLHNHKLIQLQHDFAEISKTFHETPTHIFDNAQNIFFICTGKWHTIQNLNDLYIASKRTKEYMNIYF